MLELPRLRPAVGILALSVGPALAACSSNNDAAGSGGGGSTSTDSGSFGCTGYPGVETLAVNLTHMGNSGKMSFVIANAQFIPPEAQTNWWTLKILDAAGQPVKDANVTFPIPAGFMSDPWMPQHAHGDPLIPTATNHHDGTYTLGQLYLFMGGVWSLKVDAQAGSTTDSTTFTVCVQGS
jgi:hypothetical protein